MSTTNILQKQCPKCGSFFKISEWHYQYRLTRNNGRGVFCSSKCGQLDKKQSEESNIRRGESLKKAYLEGRKKRSPDVTTICENCGKQWIEKKWKQVSKLKRSKNKKLFCSKKCTIEFLEPMGNEESRNKVSLSQLGKSCPQRGRKGRKLSEETKMKISEGMLRKPVLSYDTHWDIIKKDADSLGFDNYVTLDKTVPDIIGVKDGKLIAVEIETKRGLYEVQMKLNQYNNIPKKYDKVIIIWRWLRNPNLVLGRWEFENGVWNKTI